MKAFYSYCALSGIDENCTDYIAFAHKNPLVANMSTVIDLGQDVPPEKIKRLLLMQQPFYLHCLQ